MNAIHNAATALPETPPAAGSPTAPRWAGLLRSAWQLHRTMVVAGMGAAAALVLLLVGFRAWAAAVADRESGQGLCAGSGAQTADCRSAIMAKVWDTLSFPFAALQLACLALALGAGLLIGASSFAREFEQRTQVFALTQPVRRAPWWAAKTAVTAVPMTLSMLVLGAVAAWAFVDFPYQNQPMGVPQFYVSLNALPVLYLLTVSIAITAGILVRSTVGALVLAVVVAGLVTVGVESVRDDLAPADRAVLPTSYSSATAPTGWIVDNGYLNAAGQQVNGYYSCSLWDNIGRGATDTEYEQIEAQCQAEAGIANRYQDYIPEARYWRVRATWSAILIALSALALAVGAIRIRRRVL